MMSAAKMAAQTRSFDIEAGIAQTTLREFARQARADVVMDRRDVQGVQTNEVSGSLIPRIALERMLEGTPLVFKEDLESGAFAVTRSEIPSLDQTTQNTEPQILDETEMNNTITQKKNLLSRFLGVFAAVGLGASSPGLYAQEADEQIYELSPFTVDSSEDSGYKATSTLAGSRLNMQLRNVGSAVSVMTEEFM